MADEPTGYYQIEFETGSAQLDYAPVSEDFGEKKTTVAQTSTNIGLLTSFSNGSDILSAASQHSSITTDHNTSVARSTDEPVDDKITATTLEVETHETLTISHGLDKTLLVGNETLFAADESHGSHVSPSRDFSGNYSDRMWQLADARQQADGGGYETNHKSSAELRNITAATLSNKPVKQPDTASDVVYLSGSPTTVQSMMEGNEQSRPTSASQQITQSEERPILASTVKPLDNPVLDFLEDKNNVETTSSMIQSGTELTTESVTQASNRPRSIQEILGFPKNPTSMTSGIDIRILKPTGTQTMRMESADGRIPPTSSTDSDSTETVSKKAMVSEWPLSTIYLLLTRQKNANDIDNTSTDAVEEAEGREIELVRRHTEVQDQEQEQPHKFPTSVTADYSENESRRDDTVRSMTSALAENDDFHSFTSRTLHSDRLNSEPTLSILAESTALQLQDADEKFTETAKLENKQSVNINETGPYREKYSKTDIHSRLLTPEVSNETSSYITRTVTPNQKQKLGKNMTWKPREKQQKNTNSNAVTTEENIGMTHYSRNISDEAQNPSSSHFLHETQTYNVYNVTPTIVDHKLMMDISDEDTYLGQTVADFDQRSVDVTPELNSRSKSRRVTTNIGQSSFQLKYIPSKDRLWK